MGLPNPSDGSVSRAALVSDCHAKDARVPRESSCRKSRVEHDAISFDEKRKVSIIVGYKGR